MGPLGGDRAWYQLRVRIYLAQLYPECGMWHFLGAQYGGRLRCLRCLNLSPIVERGVMWLAEKICLCDWR